MRATTRRTGPLFPLLFALLTLGVAWHFGSVLRRTAAATRPAAAGTSIDPADAPLYEAARRDPQLAEWLRRASAPDAPAQPAARSRPMPCGHPSAGYTAGGGGPMVWHCAAGHSFVEVGGMLLPYGR